eukprot:1358811-Lingulodinium_polyedra.AAC.1
MPERQCCRTSATPTCRGCNECGRPRAQTGPNATSPLQDVRQYPSLGRLVDTQPEYRWGGMVPEVST